MTVNDGFYQVTTGNLYDAGDTIISEAGTFESDLDELNAAVQTLLNSTSGATRDAYQTLQNRWNGLASDMKDLLRQIGTMTQTTSQSYADADKQGSQLFS